MSEAGAVGGREFAGDARVGGLEFEGTRQTCESGMTTVPCDTDHAVAEQAPTKERVSRARGLRRLLLLLLRHNLLLQVDR